MKTAVVLAVLACALHVSAKVYFLEKFDDGAAWEKRWVPSEWKRGEMGQWDVSSGNWAADVEANKGLRTTENMKFHAISAHLAEPFSNRDKDLIVQFSVKHEKHEYAFCGGGYIKLMAADVNQKRFGGDTPYYIMFGPDLCGYDVSRIHAIFNHDGKNLLKKTDIKLEYDDKNEYTHVYTLVVKPDNTYDVLFDGKSKSSGTLFEHWDFPPKTIDDPTDKKPATWVDEEMMDDPADTKPADWDSIPKQIADPDAAKPEDWDSELDGEYEAPMIDNPAYKGEWKAKRISNPLYKGPWKARQIDNAEYKADVYAFDNIGTVGFELWTVNNGSIFDNIIITDSLQEATDLAEATGKDLKEREKAAKEAWDAAKKAADEANKKDEKKSGDDEDDEDDVDDVDADERTSKEDL